MESIYRQYYEEPRYRPSPLTGQRVAAGLLGRKSGSGFYRYEEGRKKEIPEPPAPAARPRRVWVSPIDLGEQLSKFVEVWRSRSTAAASPGGFALPDCADRRRRDLDRDPSGAGPRANRCRRLPFRAGQAPHPYDHAGHERADEGCRSRPLRRRRHSRHGHSRLPGIRSAARGRPDRQHRLRHRAAAHRLARRHRSGRDARAGAIRRDRSPGATRSERAPFWTYWKRCSNSTATRAIARGPWLKRRAMARRIIAGLPRPDFSRSSPETAADASRIAG